MYEEIRDVRLRETVARLDSVALFCSEHNRPDLSMAARNAKSYIETSLQVPKPKKVNFWRKLFNYEET